jgi:carbon monoxide dehydrogenase subunit G
MTRFAAVTESGAVISAARRDVWDALTDPELLATLTPLLRGINADGDVWVWQLTSISALGLTVSPCFTERMRFIDGERIEFRHQAPPGRPERAGANGWYQLADAPGGTRLAISLTLCIDLPLPKAAAPAVQRVMRTLMDRTGERFSSNLLAHLGARELAV